MYEANKEKADFWWIYVKEAHASDGARPNRDVKIRQHQTYEERLKAASGCVAELDLKIPLLIDDMENTVGNAFHGHPDRLFILSPEGTIAYRGERGPRGFDVKEMEESLAKLLASAKKEE